jgi:hypothetical protein
MKRTAVAFSLLAAVGGCVSFGNGPGGGAGGGAVGGGPACVGAGCFSSSGPAQIPGAMGPHGEPVDVRAPRVAAAMPSAEEAARATFAQGLPPEIVRQVVARKNNAGGILQAGGPAMPPAGMMPGVAPPVGIPPGYPNAAVAAAGALTGAYAGQFACARTSVRFIDPRGMKISWYIQTPDGKRGWNDRPLEAPATYNFAQAAIYRLKLSDIPDYPGVDLYPTLEVVPANQRALTFLAHSSVPVSFTPDDFRMVAAGNYVVKVIYLPDPQFQDLAVGGGLGELISTQLEPGVDPIAEAAKRGSILVIVRLGNIDLELRHSPAMDAPPPYVAPPHGPVPPGMGGHGMMVPPGMQMGPGGPMMPANPGAAPQRQVPTNLPGQAEGGLPPLPPQTNPPTPAQMAGQK